MTKPSMLFDVYIDKEYVGQVAGTSKSDAQKTADEYHGKTVRLVKMAPDKDYESKEAKLDSLEEELAGLERAFEKGDMESEEYQHNKDRINKEIQRVEGIPVDGERAEAYDIWQDVKKQFAEGKMTVTEYEKYKKMFENYQFTSPSSDNTLATFVVCAAGLFFGFLIVNQMQKMEKK